MDKLYRPKWTTKKTGMIEAAPYHYVEQDKDNKAS